MSSKVERFTNNAKMVLSHAQDAAEEENQSVIHPEHVLVGLLRVESATKRVLESAGIREQHIRQMIKRLPRPFRKPKEIDLSKETKRLLELSVAKARNRGDWYIGTGHLLLGMMEQRNSAALAAMKSLHISPEKIRDEIRQSIVEQPEVTPKDPREKLSWMIQQSEYRSNYQVHLAFTPREGETAQIERSHPLEDTVTLEQVQEFLANLLEAIVIHHHDGHIVNFVVGNFQLAISVKPTDSSGDKP